VLILFIRCLIESQFFSFKHLFVGAVGGIITSLGLVLMNKAYSIGPLGPVAALTCLQSVFFTIVESFMLSRAPSAMELSGMLVGLLGALVLTLFDELKGMLINLTKSR
jgi:drug/metabolite transporter (DMT)-like permease